jgi:FkbM family methyltransferase
MAPTRLQTARVVLQMKAPWRRWFGQSTVRRTVQGVKLTLPRSHMLPVYARVMPQYGQNLVELAVALHEGRSDDSQPLEFIDIGANIGDSTLQILARVDGRALCIEGDPYWAGYLRTNCGQDPRVTIEEVLLTPTDGEWEGASPVRVNGTTRFVQDSQMRGASALVSAGELRRRHPEFDHVRLVKSDTDGFDAVLVPAVATAWMDTHPVLFFEFDPALARSTTSRDPAEMWTALARLGYARLAIWDNLGAPLGQLDLADVPPFAAALEARPTDQGHFFWDVAASRAEDATALAAFDRLVPMPFPS